MLVVTRKREAEQSSKVSMPRLARGSAVAADSFEHSHVRLQASGKYRGVLAKRHWEHKAWQSLGFSPVAEPGCSRAALG